MEGAEIPSIYDGKYFDSLLKRDDNRKELKKKIMAQTTLIHWKSLEWVIRSTTCKHQSGNEEPRNHNMKLSKADLVKFSLSCYMAG